MTFLDFVSKRTSACLIRHSLHRIHWFVANPVDSTTESMDYARSLALARVIVLSYSLIEILP